MEKNILICGENLDDGGVETAIVNDAIALKERGNKVYILAKRGVYTEKVENFGIENIDFNFEFINGFDIERSQEIIKIIKEKSINEVHIHKFINVPTCLPACIISNVPYVVHLHEGLQNSYTWIMSTYSMFKYMLEIYFKNAYKIIAITENVKKYNMELFHIPENKYKVIPNSIDLDMFNNGIEPQVPIKKFLLISRLSNEKEKSIKLGIDLFEKYSKRVKDCKLRITGSGNASEKIKEYVKNKDLNIELIGRTQNIPEEIAQADMVLGMGRCILEAMASKRLCCIIGYENLKTILKEDIIEKAMLENFSGRGLKDENNENIINEILSLDQETLEKITNQNYEYVDKKLNIRNNVFLIDDKKEVKYENLNEILFALLGKYQKEISRTIKEKEEIWKGKLWIEEQYNKILEGTNQKKRKNGLNRVQRNFLNRL